MARTARLKNIGTPAAAPAQGLVGRQTAYHADVAGHRRIMEALGAVPELHDTMPHGAMAQTGAVGESEERWHPLKTFFFVIVFCATAWATISAAVLVAFH